jgi:hypothetical protein
MKCIKVLGNLNLRNDKDAIEAEFAQLPWKLSYDEPISQLSTGKVAEAAP